MGTMFVCPSDHRIKAHILGATPQPQTLMFLAMHQDYSSGCVAYSKLSSHANAEAYYGEVVVKGLLAGNRGHYGPLEHPAITVVVEGAPHSVMQQLRTHRVGVSFDVQSFRYTSDTIIQAARGEAPLEDIVYLRPEGVYHDREGKKVHYTQEHREEDLRLAKLAVLHYEARCIGGFPEEQARGMMPFDYRQHFVVSFNVRSLMHVLDLRHKKDAQLECQWVAELLMSCFDVWCPEIAAWYRANRLSKGRLAP